MNVEHNRMLEAHECKQRKKEPLLFSKIPHTVCVVLLSSSSIGFFSFNLVLRFSFAPSFLPSFFIIIIVILVSFFYSVCFVFYIVIIERFGYCCFFCDEHTTKEKVFCLKKKIVAILLSKNMFDE